MTWWYKLIGEKTITYLVSASWTANGSDAGDSVDHFLSQGWVWDPTPLKLAAYKALWPPPLRVCDCSRDSAFLASSSVAPPRRINKATADEFAMALESLATFAQHWSTTQWDTKTASMYLHGDQCIVGEIKGFQTYKVFQCNSKMSDLFLIRPWKPYWSDVTY